MKSIKILLISFLFLIPLSLFAEDVPQIGIIDVLSSSLPLSETSIYTDILRTEIYQMGYFTIVERGTIQQIMEEQKIALSGLTNDSQLLTIGEFLSVQKLLVCRMEQLEETVAINLKVVDVNTSMLDYSESFFVQDGETILLALKEMAMQLELFFVDQNNQISPEEKGRLQAQNWQNLGANDEEIAYLLDKKIPPSEFISMKQYDITFTVNDFIEVREKGWKIEELSEFFKEGISFHEIEEAMDLGIKDLTYYRENFKTRQLLFSEYLDAYRNQIVSPLEYLDFRNGYIKDYYRIGMGGVANSMPVMTAQFQFFVLAAGWEHYISDFQRNDFKYSFEMGANFMQAIIPSPYLQFNFYSGKYPFYLKTSLGVLAEVMLGEHYGVYAQVGLELDSSFEFVIMATFLGTQPKVSYADFETELGDPDYVNIEFPYYGAFICYKYNGVRTSSRRR